MAAEVTTSRVLAERVVCPTMKLDNNSDDSHRLVVTSSLKREKCSDVHQQKVSNESNVPIEVCNNVEQNEEAKQSQSTPSTCSTYNNENENDDDDATMVSSLSAASARVDHTINNIEKSSPLEKQEQKQVLEGNAAFVPPQEVVVTSSQSVSVHSSNSSNDDDEDQDNKGESPDWLGDEPEDFPTLSPSTSSQCRSRSSSFHQHEHIHVVVPASPVPTPTPHSSIFNAAARCRSRTLSADADYIMKDGIDQQDDFINQDGDFIMRQDIEHEDFSHLSYSHEGQQQQQQLEEETDADAQQQYTPATSEPSFLAGRPRRKRGHHRGCSSGSIVNVGILVGQSSLQDSKPPVHTTTGELSTFLAPDTSHLRDSLALHLDGHMNTGGAGTSSLPQSADEFKQYRNAREKLNELAVTREHDHIQSNKRKMKSGFHRDMKYLWERIKRFVRLISCKKEEQVDLRRSNKGYLT